MLNKLWVGIFQHMGLQIHLLPLAIANCPKNSVRVGYCTGWVDNASVFDPKEKQSDAILGLPKIL